MYALLRPARPDDADAIWRVTRAAYLPDRERLHPPSSVFKESIDDIRRAMVDGTIYAAERAGEIVAAVRVRPHDADATALYCGRLAVLPSAQRRGLGTALMARVEEHAMATGRRAVALGVRLELPENILFYERLGYRIVGEERHPGHPTPTFLWMRKDLAGAHNSTE